MTQLKYSFTILTLLWIFLPNAAHANLIVNGSFEDNPIGQSSWQWYTSNAVAGRNGSNIEIWNNLLGIDAVDGANFIELNAHPDTATQFSIYQSFNSQPGEQYNISLFYRARNSDSESFALSLSDSNTPLFRTLLDDHGTSQWHYFNTVFTASSALTTLTLSSVTPYSGTLGNLIDAVTVNQQFSNQTASTVSEPSLLWLTLLSVFGLKSRRLNA